MHRLWTLGLLALIVLSGCSDGGSGARNVGVGDVCDWAISAEEQIERSFVDVSAGPQDSPPSCYYLMTSAQDPSTGAGEGFAVELFRSSRELTSSVDGDEMPERPLPLHIAERPSVKQMLYGNRWSARTTVSLGDDSYLLVTRWAPAHEYNELDLMDDAVEVTRDILDKHFS